ncbi:MAG: hypothetical protein LKG20_07290 [Tetrasphaera jenkinsii]|jgi:hypothetical protein|uniref:Uncharacterized protein n=1 Tax=Nostocoides jenkinsii Ben 74 TaxID=1193518 RepID=A0A077MDR2_9MICO|nr:hypothetical protein [Tetrasphaera jenkinsii]MCI1262072.1 hypothetical protein [Tetrasphaera jenkinsii]CCI53077.1 conserved hypothetical protein [Tetrasphaera jenkinsii Ben 74]
MGKKAGKPTTIKVRKKCCRKKLRCKKCPVVLMRLGKMGYAEPAKGEKRLFSVEANVPKKAMLVARQR